MTETTYDAPPTEPPINGSETDTLLGTLEWQRRLFAWKCGGLDAAGTTAMLAPSTMTLGGLLKHMALVEDDHFARLLLAEGVGEPWAGVDFDADPDWEWRTAAEDSPEALMTLWEDACELSRQRVAAALTRGDMGLEGAYLSQRTGEHPTLRRIVLDMICEYARHLGHADLIRESVDGLVGEDPPGKTERVETARVPDLRIVPANEASWEDLVDVLGSSDQGPCFCQRFRTLGWFWETTTVAERQEALKAQTECDQPAAAGTSGLVAFLADEAVGWCAVAPRASYLRIRKGRSPVYWKGRQEDRDDESVWALTCFAVRKGHRGEGLTYELARAAVEFARERGARALEGYPMEAEVGKDVIWGEMFVGARQVFDEAGFTEVTHPTKRRSVMRIDF